ncbi:MAG: hypothetical protein G01um101429_902 [Parcubacteria group bacterium Gr01-1014_29]|nr:MAG: hypothetical protein G01um101429_902 [Parcubacteria group bacterium Gr01-1014_29]
MNIRYSERFKQRLKELPRAVRKKFYKQADYLLYNLRHPSLHAKKYDETKDIWQARIDRTYRFYFEIQGDTYLLTDLVKHKD